MSQKKDNYKDLIEDETGIIRNLLEVFGFDPKEEHSFDSIRQLEKLIDKNYPEGHKPLPTTLIPFGWYLTHTLIKQLSDGGINAKIEYDVNSIWDIHVKYKPSWTSKEDGEMQVYTFKRVDNFWKNREDRMSSMLEMTEVIAKHHPNSFKDMADDEGWVTLPSGTMFRIMQGEKKEDGTITKGAVKLNASKLIKGL